jgi:hypothetical protein
MVLSRVVVLVLVTTLLLMEPCPGCGSGAIGDAGGTNSYTVQRQYHRGN